MAQRSITLVLMMINSCSYSNNDLVFNKFQIFDQDLNLYLASTKDSKSMKLARVDSRAQALKIVSSTQEESSSLDHGLDQVKMEKKIFYKRFSRLESIFVSVKILCFR